jgi:hypothetical protein
MSPSESCFAPVATNNLAADCYTAVPSTTVVKDDDSLDEDHLEQPGTNTDEPATPAGETRAVLILRIALITVWVVATVLASSGVFVYTSVRWFVLRAPDCTCLLLPAKRYGNVT